jgi:predicted TIM-barrel fold metal-dependent hydrolase
MIVDIHMHVVGHGDGGTGCYMAPYMRRSFSYLSLVRMLGVAGADDFDRAVRERLVGWIRSSGLDAAVLLAQDAVHDERGRRRLERSSFYTPNDYVAAICRDEPGLLFGASVHPARRDALAELDRCVELGAVLLKVHPVLYGIDLRSPACRRVWRHAASLGLPILVHTGVINALFPKKRYAGDPARLRPLLDEGATVIAAHAGRATPLSPPAYQTVLRRLMEKYPRLYTDTAALAQSFMAHVLRRLLRDPFWCSRFCHGSDFPVPPLVDPWTAKLGIGECLRFLRDSNPVRRDLQLKRRMGCPEQVLHRGARLLREPPGGFGRLAGVCPR